LPPPPFLLMTVFYLAPVLQVLMISFTEPTAWLDNYERLFTSMGVLRLIEHDRLDYRA
jgi:putative spermidine/putrescine transport system permease protein